MTIFTTQALSAIAVIVAASALSACQKPAGPAERAGQAIDKSTAKVGQEIERAGERIQDAAKGKRIRTRALTHESAVSLSS